MQAMTTFHPVFDVSAQFQSRLAHQGRKVHHVRQCGRGPNKIGSTAKGGIHVTQYGRLLFCVSVEIRETKGIEGAIDTTGQQRICRFGKQIRAILSSKVSANRDDSFDGRVLPRSYDHGRPAGAGIYKITSIP